MENNTYIEKTLVCETHIDDLDHALREEFGYDYSNEDTDFITIEPEYGRADGYPIRIDELVTILKSMQDKGATHVELDYHCDHIGYDISAFLIKTASEKAVSSFIEKEKLERERAERRAELLKQLRDLEKEGTKPDEDYPF